MSKFYRLINDFQERFANGVPALAECKGLDIKGDFSFGKNVKLVGDVVLDNSTDTQVQIEDGAVLQGTLTWED